MNVTEHEWMAYVDGQLDAEASARVEAAMVADPALAGMVAAQQRLRRRLRAAFDPVLEEPVPGRLVEALAPPRASSPGLPWLSLAASLALGVLLAGGWHATRQDPLRMEGDAVVAHGALARVLDRSLAAEAPVDGMGVGLSFRDRAGTHCRTFSVAATSMAGLACRGDGGWRIVALAESPDEAATGTGLRPAGTALPPAILAEVGARVRGEPFDAGQERAARDAGWR